MSNYMYLHPQQTDLVLATPGLYIRGVTSGAWGLITKRDDTNKYIYIDRQRDNAFATGETLKLTTNGKASGDTGISYTNEAGAGSIPPARNACLSVNGAGLPGPGAEAETTNMGLAPRRTTPAPGVIFPTGSTLLLSAGLGPHA